MTGRKRIYRIDATLAIGGEVRRIATARLDAAVIALREGSSSSRADRAAAATAIDDVRSLLRLVRGGLDSSSRRAAASRLRSAQELVTADNGRPILDGFEWAAQVAADTVTAAALHRLRLSLRQQTMLQASVQALADDQWNGPSGSEAAAGSSGGRRSFNPRVSIADDLDDAILGASLWVIHGDGFAPLAAGFEREYRRGREALAEAVEDNGADAQQALARRVSDHARHLMLLAPVWPKVMEPMVKEAHRLTQLVDRQHEVGVLRTALLDLHDPQLSRDAGALVGVLDEQMVDLAAVIRSLGGRIYADEPATATARYAIWWAAADPC